MDENTTLRSEKSVKALGVIIVNRLTFSDHLSACCLKAARQLNALARISKYLDPKSKSIIYNSFIRSNFEYCQLVGHFCGKTNNNKLEKIQERLLRILQDTYELSYEELLNRNGYSTLLLHRIKLLLLETYKSFHGIYHAPSRILAFWLMLSVLCTSINKVYLILFCLILGCEFCHTRRFDTIFEHKKQKDIWHQNMKSGNDINRFENGILIGTTHMGQE